eukprot:COSAG06_NODE_1320_length_9872_cov_49.877213_13_plen_72_part_00
MNDRKKLLELMYQHSYQFNTLRQARHATMMVRNNPNATAKCICNCNALHCKVLPACPSTELTALICSPSLT